MIPNDWYLQPVDPLRQRSHVGIHLPRVELVTTLRVGRLEDEECTLSLEVLVMDSRS